MFGFSIDLNLFLLCEAAALVAYKSQLGGFFPASQYSDVFLPDLIHVCDKQLCYRFKRASLLCATLGCADQFSWIFDSDVFTGAFISPSSICSISFRFSWICRILTRECKETCLCSLLSSKSLCCPCSWRKVSLEVSTLENKLQHYYINFGMFLGIFIFWISVEKRMLGHLLLGVAAIFQLTIGLALSRVPPTDEKLFNVRASGDDIVRIRISILQLFKNFKFSVFLLCIYWFYCFTMMRYEVSHFLTAEKNSHYFMFVPLIYSAINFTSGRLMNYIRNWYMLCLVLLGVQINLTILETIVRSRYPDLELLAFLTFAVNTSLMQKVVFVAINSTMLQIFDVENLRVRNYLCCGLISDTEQGALGHQRAVDNFRCSGL